MASNIIKTIQIVVTVGIVALVLVQGKGGGLSNTFGGGIQMYRSKRGVEKVLFILTIVLIAAFVINSLLLLSLG
jgi:preprotein translocase subunit SecG